MGNVAAPLTPGERQQRIRQMAEHDHLVKVEDLMDLLGVSDETVRRDLLRLEQDGIVRRIYGGAVLIAGRRGEPSFDGREVRNVHQKRRIAAAARRLIQAGDTVLFDASTTVLELARLLPDGLPLTVVTNSIHVLGEMARKGIAAICTGGQLRPKMGSLVGPLAERALTGYHVDRAFVSCGGLHAQEGATDASDLEVELKRRMRRAANETVFLVDGSKFGRVAFCTICETREIGSVITDGGAPPEVVEALRAAGAQVEIAE